MILCAFIRNSILVLEWERSADSEDFVACDAASPTRCGWCFLCVEEGVVSFAFLSVFAGI